MFKITITSKVETLAIKLGQEFVTFATSRSDAERAVERFIGDNTANFEWEIEDLNEKS